MEHNMLDLPEISLIFLDVFYFSFLFWFEVVDASTRMVIPALQL
jgi:hypothetical protein